MLTIFTNARACRRGPVRGTINLRESNWSVCALALLSGMAVTGMALPLRGQNVFPATGSVGIGTRTPAGPLEIRSDSPGYGMRI